MLVSFQMDTPPPLSNHPHTGGALFGRLLPQSTEMRPRQNFSTLIVSGRASPEEHEQAIEAGERAGTVLENCPKCNAVLDVSACTPLTETSCPSCGALIKVLREFHLFVLLSKLGQGGAGTVYRAFDETLERDVALKLLRNERTRDRTYIDGLEREAQITASISHPNVVKVYSTGCKNGYFYIAMEIVSGGSLAKRIQKQGTLPEATVLSIGVQIAEGLRAALQRQLLHRDVKPGNILFADRDALKVADFGLALPLSQTADDSGEIWGTPEYIAPEKLLGRGEDARSDIYSLGCTLFHCLAGAPPLDTAVVMEAIKTQVAPAAPNIQDLKPEVSGGTAFVIQRCLETDPANRYQSYDELIEHLEYARNQDHRANTPRPSSPGAAKGSKFQKKTMAAVKMGLLLLVIAGAGSFFALRPKPPRDETVLHPALVPTENLGPAEPSSIASQLGAERFRAVDMQGGYNFDTRTPLSPENPRSYKVSFTHFGLFDVHGIPFEVTDPERSKTGFNITILKTHAPPFPAKVNFSVPALAVRSVHILGGVAQWGWLPNRRDRFMEPVVKLSVIHQGGSSEEFEFRNGMEFADFISRADVPGSTYAEGVATNSHQVRTFSVQLSNPAPVEKLTLESLSAKVSPIFVAMTLELADQADKGKH